MNQQAMYKLSYGLFVATTHGEKGDNGCIINTAVQAASSPNLMSICVNKANLTCDCIRKTGMYSLSVISRDAPFELFKRFGFQSGRTVDKFADYKECKRGANGIYYITEGTNARFDVRVVTLEDLGSHMMFIGEITDMDVLSEVPSATYEYYMSDIKPKPIPVGQTSDNRTIWRCRICGNEFIGEEIPNDYICPVCKHPAADFEKVM